jgi:predicted nucleic acid-binding protein
VVCLDSSILISLYRNPNMPGLETARSVIIDGSACLCGQVWVETVGGFRSNERRAQCAENLAEFPWLDTPREAYELAADWVARHAGIGAGDAIIAATVKLADARLLTCDKAIAVLKREGVKIDLV